MPGITELATGRRVWLDEFAELIDSMPGLSARQMRNLERAYEAYKAKWTDMQRDHYEPAAERYSRDIEQVVRICEEAVEMFRELRADLEDGRKTGKQVLTGLGPAKTDIDRLRKLAADAEKGEEKVWELIDMEPGAYQRHVARRMPALMSGGRGLAVVTESMLNGTEEPKF